jgi:subtilisin family serine protease
MGIRAATMLAVASALTVAPAAWGQGSFTVSYATPSALRGLNVVRRVDALHVAEVRSTSARALRGRPGIRWVQRTTLRTRTAEPALESFSAGSAVPEWQYAATRSDLVPAWVLRAAANVTIAVVDTGADLSAPDLAAKNPITHNVVTGGSDVQDAVGHGTFVASLAAGSITNGEGIAGFGGDAQLMIVQANRTANTFTDVDEAAGITWAVDNGAKIVNLSLGGSQTSRIERAAIDYAVQHGVLLVAAAGNDGERSNAPEYPAALLGGHGLAVGASTVAGGRASFSNAGSYLSLAAPGVNVLGAVASSSPAAAFPRTSLPGASAGLYGFGSGTSYAAPEVAGAAALVWAANPTLSADEVAALLEQTASGNGTWTAHLGYGVVNVAAAVARATGAPLPAAATAQPAGPRTAKPKPKAKAKHPALRVRK